MVAVAVWESLTLEITKPPFTIFSISSGGPFTRRRMGFGKLTLTFNPVEVLCLVIEPLSASNGQDVDPGEAGDEVLVS